MTEVQIRSQVNRHRKVGSGWLIVLLVLTVLVDRFVSMPLMSLISGLPPEEIGNRGIEPLQSIFIAAYKLPFGIVYSALLATLVEKQLRPDAFGKYSRWGIVFLVCLYCFCTLATR